jgi:hypothetical protein
VAPPTWLDRLTTGFSGRVVDERGQPLAGALVVAMNARPAGAPGLQAAGTASDRARRRSGPSAEVERAPVPVAFAMTEGDGRFALPVLPPGRHMLFALHIGPPPATSDALIVNAGFLAAPLRLVIARRRPALL